jgi:hypothetical protein
MRFLAAARARSASGADIVSTVRPVLLCVGLCLAFTLSSAPAFALSEIKREELPAPTSPASPQGDDTEKSVPLPDPLSPTTSENPAKPDQADPDDATQPVDPDRQDVTSPRDPDEPVPEVLYDFSQLPPDVKRLRDQILEVTKSGDIEKLRPLIGMGDDMTQLSLITVDGDPIDYLKSLAGDEDGQEILAILEEVLSAGYVHLDAGKPEELYVWPYFFAVPLDKLTGPQRVELFKIVTAGDYEEMKNFGSYIFYRVGITPQGKWAFFVAGE